MPVTLYEGDCLRILPTLSENSIDATIVDAPYHLTQLSRGGSPRVNDPATPFGRTRLGDRGFIGLTWDGGDVAFRPETWAEVRRVMKPGAFLVSFGGCRTYHHMAMAIECAGFEIADAIVWAHGQGFPKKGYIRDHDGNPVREGWAGCLKPAIELIVLAKKPLEGGTIAKNMSLHGTGAMNIDACRIPALDEDYTKNCSGDRGHADNRKRNLPYNLGCGTSSEKGRWPTNLIHDSSDEVLDVFASFGEKKSGDPGVRRKPHETRSMAGRWTMTGESEVGYGDSGSIARFFQPCPFEDEALSRVIYASKVKNKADRFGSNHPTIKPLSLMRYLCKLIIPPGGIVLDPFAGSGTTGQAAAEQGFDAILIEREPEYCNDIRRRLSLFLENDYCQ